MAESITQQFMSALRQIERTKDPEPLVALFGDDAELRNLSRNEPSQGVDGAREFWQRYLGDFGDIASTFEHVVEGPDGAAMEWISEGTLAKGSPIAYRGVSIIETADGKVRRFRTYYDTAAFVAGTTTA